MNAARLLLMEMRSLDVMLFIEDGRLAFDGPEDVITDAIVELIRAHRDGLMFILRDETKQLDAPEEMPVGVECPWCRGRRLIDDPYGLRCWDCDRMAWVYVPGAIVRLDYTQSDFDNFPLTNNRGSNQ